jgi:hypothetical protein
MDRLIVARKLDSLRCLEGVLTKTSKDACELLHDLD